MARSTIQAKRRARIHAPRSLFAPALLSAYALFVGPTFALGQTFVPVAIPDLASHIAFSTGASWVDYDQDGDLDLYVVTGFSSNRENRLYRNDGGDAFTAVTADPIVTDATQNVCSSWADVDNDGQVDAYVSGLDTDGGRLYRAAGGGAFLADESSGVSGTSIKGTGCAWGDYDNDGRLDLVISVLDGVLGMSGGNRLFHQAANGTFTEAIGDPVGSNPDSHHHVTWSDFDRDGDLDLFFATGNAGSTALDRLYRNQWAESGSATFTPITTGILATDPRDSQALSFVDYDNDGDLDCYAINYTSVPNQLYRNDGAVFTKITTGAIVTDLGRAHGVAWGDYDNDGDLDVYVARDLNQPNRYYRNNGDGSFTSITTGPHVTGTRSNYNAVAGDYDLDGDLDLFVPTARSEGPSVLFRNDLASGAHWLEVKLVGVTANRSGIGAKVRARAVIGGVPRWQTREVSSCTGYGGANQIDPHFGLADAVMVDSLVVEWPGGAVDVKTGVPVDQRLTFVQGFSVAVSEHEGHLTPGIAALTVCPNPFSDSARLSLRIEQAGDAAITIHDAGGRELARLFSGQIERGALDLALDGDALPSSGVYWVRVESGRQAASRRVVLRR